jgi:hypothetical protein
MHNAITQKSLISIFTAIRASHSFGLKQMVYQLNLLYTGDTRLNLSHIIGFLTENIHGFA